MITWRVTIYFLKFDVNSNKNWGRDKLKAKTKHTPLESSHAKFRNVNFVKSVDRFPNQKASFYNILQIYCLNFRKNPQQDAHREIPGIFRQIVKS